MLLSGLAVSAPAGLKLGACRGPGNGARRACEEASRSLCERAPRRRKPRATGRGAFGQAKLEAPGPRGHLRAAGDGIDPPRSRDGSMILDGRGARWPAIVVEGRAPSSAEGSAIATGRPKRAGSSTRLWSRTTEAPSRTSLQRSFFTRTQAAETGALLRRAEPRRDSSSAPTAGGCAARGARGRRPGPSLTRHVAVPVLWARSPSDYFFSLFLPSSISSRTRCPPLCPPAWPPLWPISS